MSRWFPERALLWLRPEKADPALGEFECELDRRALPRGTRLHCVVAGEGARYRVVPWHDEFTSPQQRQVLGTSCFTEAYGEAARGWAVREHATRHGAATLACALDTALLDRLAALALARGLKLASVQPALMRAYNQARHQLAAGSFWFVWLDGPHTTLLLMAAGEPLLVKPLPPGEFDLGAQLDREWFVLGMEAERCPVYIARAAGQSERRPSPGAWQLIDLPPMHEGAVALPQAEVFQ